MNLCVRICEFLNYVMSLIQMPEGRCLMEEIERRGSGTQDTQIKRERGAEEIWGGKRKRDES